MTLQGGDAQRRRPKLTFPPGLRFCLKTNLSTIENINVSSPLCPWSFGWIWGIFEGC